MEQTSNRVQPDDDVVRSVTKEANDLVWRRRLPVLNGHRVRLRELRRSDAASLLSMLACDDVSRFISAPPTTLEGFERFINWAISQRVAGAYACFAVTLRGSDIAIGLLQLGGLDQPSKTAEWGFAIGSAFWGTGVFQEAAELVLDFAFNTVGVRRLEARAAVKNGRGNGALLKLGAVQEGLLRKSFVRNGVALDQVLYSILNDDWQASHRIAVSIEHLPMQVH